MNKSKFLRLLHLANVQIDMRTLDLIVTLEDRYRVKGDEISLSDVEEVERAIEFTYSPKKEKDVKTS